LRWVGAGLGQRLGLSSIDRRVRPIAARQREAQDFVAVSVGREDGYIALAQLERSAVTQLAAKPARVSPVGRVEPLQQQSVRFGLLGGLGRCGRHPHILPAAAEVPFNPPGS
jgi:hypothetical protein